MTDKNSHAAIDIDHLAHLARIEVTPEEKEGLAHDLPKILDYVKDINNLTTNADGRHSAESAAVRNVVREDEITDVSGLHTETLLESAPDRKGQYIKVKKVL